MPVPDAVMGSSLRREYFVLGYLTTRFGVAVATSLVTSLVFAQSTPLDSGSDSLEEIVVVANRAPEPLSKVGSSVTVLNDVAIKASQEPMVSDLLAATPGINFVRNGGVGTSTSIFIRGADSDQTVVVIDGVQINDPSSTGGGFDFANLLTGDISRIEILRGAQSTLYGSQAIGGVINIITADPSAAFGGGASAEGGSHDTGYVTANVGGKDDALMWRIAGNWYGTSGIPAFDETYGGTRDCASQIGGGSARLSYQISPDLKFDLRGFYAQARTDFDGYDTPNGTFGNDNEYGKTDEYLGYAGLTYQEPGASVTHRLAVQYTDTNNRNYDPDAPANYGSLSTETFYGIGRNTREEYQGTFGILPELRAVFGAQHELSTISTDTPAYDYGTPMPLERYATINSVYSQVEDQILGGLTVTAGGRYDKHDVYGGHATGAISAAWELNERHTILRASFGQGFKAPSLYQLYSNYGNLALQPEVANSWDAGIEQHFADEHLQLSATYFQRDSRDLIEFFDCTTPNGLCASEPFGYYANIERAAARGVELQTNYTPVSSVTLAANYTLTNTEDRSPGSPTYGNELPRRPKNMANASVSYCGTLPLTSSVSARYAGRSFDDAANEVELGGYVLVDVRFSYSVRSDLEFYGRVENLTGKHYETAYEYGTLGRVAYAGVRTKF